MSLSTEEEIELANPKKIDGEVLRFLFKEDWPVTTEMVGIELKVSWNTAQMHLLRLLSENLLKGKRVGRQNQWMLTEKGKKVARNFE